ncbi:MAG: tripartite tricarboxylate transporter substrate binding protein [Burkholderiales bacterium]|nr:tripartite tricarboxylate transporter substrate binding protein [Burkholderiales bacterium]
MHPVRLFTALAGVACALAGTAGSAFAQQFPSKTIRIIVPYGPGGPTDSIARVFAQEVSKTIGRPVIVENQPGASSVIGMQACANAPADGHTLCLTVGDSLSYNPYLFKTLPYDPFNDFAPVINLARGNSLLVANAASPFSNYKELVTQSKASPGKFNWGTWGASTTPDVYLQWVKHVAGIDIVGVPYKGAVPTLTALLSGEINVTFMSIGFALQNIKAGKIKPIAVVGDKRSSVLPEVAALAEDGADPGLASYFGVFAPAKTPRAVVEQLNAHFGQALATPAVKEFLRIQTLDGVGGSPAAFESFVKADQKRAAEIFRTLGIKPGDSP